MNDEIKCNPDKKIKLDPVRMYERNSNGYVVLTCDDYDKLFEIARHVFGDGSIKYDGK